MLWFDPCCVAISCLPCSWMAYSTSYILSIPDSDSRCSIELINSLCLSFLLSVDPDPGVRLLLNDTRELRNGIASILSFIPCLSILPRGYSGVYMMRNSFALSLASSLALRSSGVYSACGLTSGWIGTSCPAFILHYLETTVLGYLTLIPLQDDERRTALRRCASRAKLSSFYC